MRTFRFQKSSKSEFSMKSPKSGQWLKLKDYIRCNDNWHFSIIWVQCMLLFLAILSKITNDIACPLILVKSHHKSICYKCFKTKLIKGWVIKVSLNMSNNINGTKFAQSRTQMTLLDNQSKHTLRFA